MWSGRSNKSRKEEREAEAAKQRADLKPAINQGVYYLYVIMGLQVLFVFGIMGIIMFIGKVISTPGWVLLFIVVLFAAGTVYLYRKARKKVRKLKESFGKADRNYEISIMGGMLTVRIEQNASGPKLLEAPLTTTDEPVIDAEAKGDIPAQKPAHLS